MYIAYAIYLEYLEHVANHEIWRSLAYVAHKNGGGRPFDLTGRFHAHHIVALIGRHHLSLYTFKKKAM